MNNDWTHAVCLDRTRSLSACSAGIGRRGTLKTYGALQVAAGGTSAGRRLPAQRH